jgi:hypothetical protein
MCHSDGLAVVKISFEAVEKLQQVPKSSNWGHQNYKPRLKISQRRAFCEVIFFVTFHPVRFFDTHLKGSLFQT